MRQPGAPIDLDELRGDRHAAERALAARRGGLCRRPAANSGQRRSPSGCSRRSPTRSPTRAACAARRRSASWRRSAKPREDEVIDGRRDLPAARPIVPHAAATRAARPAIDRRSLARKPDAAAGRRLRRRGPNRTGGRQACTCGCRRPPDGMRKAPPGYCGDPELELGLAVEARQPADRRRGPGGTTSGSTRTMDVPRSQRAGTRSRSKAKRIGSESGSFARHGGPRRCSVCSFSSPGFLGLRRASAKTDARLRIFGLAKNAVDQILVVRGSRHLELLAPTSRKCTAFRKELLEKAQGLLRRLPETGIPRAKRCAMKWRCAHLRAGSHLSYGSTVPTTQSRVYRASHQAVREPG